MSNQLSPLLQQADDNPSFLWNKCRQQVTSQSCQWHRFANEIVLLLQKSLPVIIAYALQNSLQTSSLLIVGRTSPENLATAAFSYMFATCTGWLIGMGGTTALDTLASSAFTSRLNEQYLGVLLQRAFLVLGLMYMPVIVLWVYAEPIFLVLGQDAYLSKSSASFLSCLIPGGLGYIYFEAMKKYLQAQGIMSAGTYVLLLVFPVNILLNYMFCNTLKMGLLGAPLATGISYWLCFILLILYSVFISGHQCWGGWTTKAFQNLGVFARLAILGIINVGAEWWAFEIVAIAAGWLGIIPMSAQSVIMTTDQILNTIPFGIGVAASSRVGNFLGARDAYGAARTAKAAAYLSICLGTAIMAILMLSRHQFAKIFSDDADVISLTSAVMPFVAAFQIADGLNSSCGGCLRGMGRQHIGAAINLISYYCAALPLGIWLSFHGYGLAGLWIGQCLALYIVGILEWVIVAWSDWNGEIERAFSRMDQEDTDASMGEF
ncbi:Multi antimicrobial extrusion protein [Penicillium expansum]|nr:Multi antimicrobial extrusion protein [Penicillium expansum]